MEEVIGEVKGTKELEQKTELEELQAKLQMAETPEPIEPVEEEEEREQKEPDVEEEKAQIVDRMKEVLREIDAKPPKETVTITTDAAKAAPKPAVIKFSGDELNAAAGKLLEVIQDYASEGLRDMAENQLCIPLWQYLAGVLFSAYNEGRMGVIDLDPAWSEEGFGDTYHECVICNKEFTPKAMGQRVCDTACGIVLAQNTRIANGEVR